MAMPSVLIHDDSDGVNFFLDITATPEIQKYGDTETRISAKDFS
jgi:hypothetical protein